MRKDWRDIPGWEGLYQASRCGEIRGVDRVDSAGRKWPGKVLSSRSGRYASVGLCRDGNRFYLGVHALVLITFVSPRPKGHYACHLDGNTFNNRVSNLYWGTCQENATDRDAHGNTVRGSRVHTAVLSESDVLDIRDRLRRGAAGKDLAAEFGVGRTTISSIKHRKSWSHLDQPAG